MNEKAVYACVDQEHDAWSCRRCGYIENFEADGPVENGWSFCPGCGREIVTEVDREERLEYCLDYFSDFVELAESYVPDIVEEFCEKFDWRRRRWKDEGAVVAMAGKPAESCHAGL